MKTPRSSCPAQAGRTSAWRVPLPLAILLAIVVAGPETLDAQIFLQSKLGGFLHVNSSTGALGASISLQPFSGNNQQTWFLRGGTWGWEFTSALGRTLDVQWGATSPGTPVQLWDANGGPAQGWRPIDAGDGYFYFQSALGTYLDVQWGDPRAGTPVWTWSFTGTDAQKWRLVFPQTVLLTNIGPKCPRYRHGSKDFAGWVPSITVGVSLRVSADRRSILADVSFTAEVFAEFLHSSRGDGRWTDTVFRVPDDREIVGVVAGQRTAFFEGSGGSAGGEFLGCQDGTVITWRRTSGLVSAVHFIGDTGGPDLSDDDDCRCDTQLRGIEFRPVTIAVH